jgi:hypothetical protein
MKVTPQSTPIITRLNWRGVRRVAARRLADGRIGLSPDGTLTALGENYAAELAGWAVLAEHTEVAR